MTNGYFQKLWNFRFRMHADFNNFFSDRESLDAEEAHVLASFREFIASPGTHLAEKALRQPFINQFIGMAPDGRPMEYLIVESAIKVLRGKERAVPLIRSDGQKLETIRLEGRDLITPGMYEISCPTNCSLLDMHVPEQGPKR